MRVDEKQVDGPELERAEEQNETLLAERKEAELPQIAGEEQVREPDGKSGGDLLVAMQHILEHKHLNISRLQLPQREARALEALQAAVEGKNATGMFVYAEDRRSMLEQSLAVLQPNLTLGNLRVLQELREGFEQLTKQVGELREQLANTEDGQDELMAADRVAFTKGEAGDTDDKPSDPDAPRPPSTLSKGPEVTRADKPSALSTGPDAKREDAKSTLSTGPAVERTDKETGIWAEDAMSKGAHAMLERHVNARNVAEDVAREAFNNNKLAEREAKEGLAAEAEVATAGDGGEKKKKPWWRKPFG